MIDYPSSPPPCDPASSVFHKYQNRAGAQWPSTSTDTRFMPIPQAVISSEVDDAVLLLGKSHVSRRVMPPIV